MKHQDIYRLVLLAFLSAASLLLAKLFRFPIFVAAPFLKMDFGEVPLLIAAYLFPSMGLFALVLKELMSFFFFGTNALALVADFLACGTFLGVFSLLVAHRRDKKSMLMAILLGTGIRALAAIPINLVILQLQYGSSIETIWMQMPYIIPFNMLKCVLDGTVFFALYKRLSTVCKFA